MPESTEVSRQAAADRADRALPGSPLSVSPIVSRAGTSRIPRAGALLVAAALALPLLSACQTQGATPPPGSITADRAIGDLLVRFTDPPVIVSLDAGNLLDKVQGPIRYVVKRPMSGGVWLVTAITQDPAATIEQAITTLRAAPRILSVDVEQRRQPARAMPTSRDMPPDNPPRNGPVNETAPGTGTTR